ncbi:neuroendocrine protein 7B2-like isoform X2 [Acanthaster planci]|uniref:Neuroendocrine protein 7B2 n=1 Tax=Acanthaster planci TaxID=133434 RepID=A0A8B7ZIJ1_ACAPL|nr:neuroendocrine protein 7B2-like isoform X2 [Acanthaster planci]
MNFPLLVLSSALFLVCSAYPFSSSDRLALRSYLRDALLGDIGDAMVGPATREESAANNKLIVPPNTFVSGGAGEGKQHLGSLGKIPNKQVAIPEIHSGYSTPPNPCPKTMDEAGKDSVKSLMHPRLTCFCEPGWQDDQLESLDCTESDKCCLATMSNTAAFVSQYQETGEAEEQQYMPFKRSPGLRRPATKRFNPYLDDQPRIQGVVAKKSPGLSSFPAM